MTVQQRALADRLIADVRRSVGDPPESQGPDVAEPGQQKVMMRYDNKTETLGALALFILGMAGGAALTLLYAPASGAATRLSLGKGAGQAREQVAAAARKARELAAGQGSRAAATVAKVRPAVDAALMRGRRGFEQGREVFQ